MTPADAVPMRLTKTFPGSRWAGPALLAHARRRADQWDRLAKDPRDIQLETLLSHCRAARDTCFGRAHDLGAVRSHADFIARVPVAAYEDFEPCFSRMRAGEADVLWPGRVRYFARSAGSSTAGNVIKQLPISEQQLRHQKRQAFDILARYLAMSGDRDYTGGFSLALLQPPTIEWRDAIGYTSNPRLMQRMMPLLSRPFILPRPAVRDLEDFDDKFAAIARAYLDHDVRSLSGTTCWFGTLFDRLIAEARARGRAVSTVAELWPNLRVLFGGGVNAEAYRPLLDARVGRPVLLVDIYNATEGGGLAVTDRAGEGTLLMMPHGGVYFEFIARSELGSPGAVRVPLGEVELDVDYSIAVTTASGLFGYALGDVVRFVSKFPHRMVFAGRAHAEISVAHEMTTQRQIEEAVARASARHPCQIVEFAATGEVGSDGRAAGRYCWFFEFDTSPRDLCGYTRALDEGLCAQNRLYKKHRTRDVGILSPQVISLPRGLSQRFAAASGRRGLQSKFPRILDAGQSALLRSLIDAR